MSEWKEKYFHEVIDIRVSNVDKKIYPNKSLVMLCNYMDTYTNDYISSKISFSIGSADLNEIQKFGLKNDDVIITKDSETPEDIAVSTVVIEDFKNLVCGYHLAILRSNKNELDGKYLMLKLKSDELRRYFLSVAKGSTRFGLTIGDIENAKIKFPTLAKQRRIASILTTTDAVIEKTQAAIAKYKAIKQGMLHDLFTRGIDPATKKLRPTHQEAPELYKESKLGWIPKEWEEERLEKICEINPHANLPSALKPNDEVSFLKMEDVSNDAEILNQNTREILNVFKKGFTPFIENDILFAKITPCMENGKGALANKLKNGFGFGSTEFHVIRARAEKSIKFLFYLTTSNAFRLNAEGKMSGSAGQQRVPTSFLQDFQIAIPPIDEQFEIGLRIDSCNSKIKSEQTYLHKLQQIKKGLMEDLLSGKKRVKI